VFLLENPGRAVPKEDIMAVVWPDTFVSENSLTRAIAQIRKVLDDDPKAPRYIETIPTVGCRFVGDSEEEPNPPAASEVSDSSVAALVASMPGAKPGRPRPYPGAAMAVVAVILIGVAVGGWLFFSRKAQALTSRDTIVLADFANSTADP
jgi:hypothetical protein